MMRTVLYPTAGYIPDLAQGAEPGQISVQEREHLRTLARKVAEIANSPKQEEKRKLWYQHNRLGKIRPMVLVFPEDSWIEIIGENELKVKDPYWRQLEWCLKHLIYRDENLHDDFVIEPDLYVTPIIHISGWGLEPKYIHPESQKGAVRWESPIKNLDDIKKLRYPTLEIDEKATQKKFESVSKVFGDLLPVQIYYPRWTSANLIGEATTLRGIEQVMWDMHDNPEWLHELMEFITEGNLRILKYLEENKYLSLNNQNHYTDSGGVGYTDELPAQGFNGINVRLCDLWGFGVAQELSEVGPDQHEEFVLRYQVRILEKFGLNAYGCCEPYANKFHMLKKVVPRLRRISISPWCDVEKAAESLQDKFIFSWKPNPAMIVGKFDTEKIRAYIQRTLEVTKDCVLEIILKDTFTIEKEPVRLETWTRIVREEIERGEY